MYCFNCGEEIKENSKFCSKCGTNQDATETNEYNAVIKVNNEILNNIVVDGKKSLLKFASKEPFKAFNKDENIFVGSGILVIFVLLYAFAVNTNVIQILNEVLGYFFAQVSARYGAYIDTPDMQIELAYDLFGNFLLIGVVSVILDVTVSFFCLYLRKKEYSMKILINNIALSYLPFIIGLVVNLIVGNFCAPATLGIYVASFIIHLIFLYKGIQSMYETEDEPIWEYSIYILVVGIIISIMLFNAIDSGIGMAFDKLEAYVGSLTGNVLDKFGW